MSAVSVTGGVAGESGAEDRWNRWFRHLPLGLLALATAVALATGPATGATSPTPRLAAQLVLVAVAAGWIGWSTFLRPEWSEQRPGAVANYVLRTVLAFLLTVLNPLFCIFAWIGFLDAADIFRGRALPAAFAATAFTMAVGQSGGFPLGSWAHAALFAALLLLNFGLALALGSYSLHIARTSEERAEALTELERVNASLQQALDDNAQLQDTVVAQAREVGVQEERQRLAREIHDTIAQSLAGVVAQLHASREDSEPAVVRRRVERAADLARDALVEARRSMMDLVPSPLADGSLVDAVTALVDDWGRHHPVEAATVVTGEGRPLHLEVEATLLRTVQEALSNVAKHAGATRVGVTLSYLDDEVALDVRDDGAGFDSGGASAPSSLGLRGMRQRAERLAGVLDLETAPGDGTALSVRLPALERGAA